MKDSVQDLLAGAIDASLATVVVKSFREVEEAFALSQWKTTGVSVGHFVEAVRRVLELRLFGAYTPINKSLPPLTSKEMARYESASGNDGYRILIPRTIFAIYALRNKRGYGHLSLEVANRVDAAFMFDGAKWILSEILRIESDKSTEETDQLVAKVTERRLPVTWNAGDVDRVLRTGLSLRQQLLLLLFQKQRVVSLDELVAGTEGKPPYVKRTLRVLTSERLLEFNEQDGSIRLSPTGNRDAEMLLLELA